MVQKPNVASEEFAHHTCFACHTQQRRSENDEQFVSKVCKHMCFKQKALDFYNHVGQPHGLRKFSLVAQIHVSYNGK